MLSIKRVLKFFIDRRFSKKKEKVVSVSESHRLLIEKPSPQGWIWRAEVIEWIDGDTVEVLFDRGFGDHSVRRVRLLGIDTPELRGRHAQPEEGTLSQLKALELAPIGSSVIIRSEKWDGRHESERGAMLDKYGRILGEIWGSDTKSVNHHLLEQGLARPYV